MRWLHGFIVRSSKTSVPYHLVVIAISTILIGVAVASSPSVVAKTVKAGELEMEVSTRVSEMEITAHDHRLYINPSQSEIDVTISYDDYAIDTTGMRDCTTTLTNLKTCVGTGWHWLNAFGQQREPPGASCLITAVPEEGDLCSTKKATAGCSPAYCYDWDFNYQGVWIDGTISNIPFNGEKSEGYSISGQASRSFWFYDENSDNLISKRYHLNCAEFGAVIADRSIEGFIDRAVSTNVHTTIGITSQPVLDVDTQDPVFFTESVSSDVSSNFSRSQNSGCSTS